jgi:hypothetical protein
MRVTRRHLLVSAASLLAFAPIGCASVSDKSEQGKSSFAQRLPWGKKKKTLPDPYPNPVKLAATWTPDSLVQTGRTPTRGFGGRVFFYDEKSRPVPVDGTLVVHGFDETVSKTDPEVKRYEFTPEQFTRHFSQSDLGASYSVWIPWDALGGVQRKVSLVASFKTKEGKLVQGVPATVMLPGRRAELGEDDAASKFAVQYKEYLKATKSVSTRSSGLTTTTIPRRRGQRLPGEAIQPGITIPAAADSGEMIAKANSTPAVDLQNTRRSSGTIALPASAQLRSRR